MSELNNHNPKFAICASVSTSVESVGVTLGLIWIGGGSSTPKISPHALRQLGKALDTQEDLQTGRAFPPRCP